MKSTPKDENLNEENYSKPEEKINSEEDILKKPEEDNTRYGDWVKNGRTIDF